MTSATWKNFYVSEYDLEMHSENVTDFAERRRHTDLDHALQALDRLKDTIEELRRCTDPHAKESITYSIKAKLRDSEIAIKHFT